MIPQSILDSWPNCAVPDCPNKTCLKLDSDKCWPHTVNAPVINGAQLTESQRTKLELVYRQKQELKYRTPS
jgi:hypothetical protein